jgi:hypothetical protein
MPAGRPTKYNVEISDKICEIISTSNRSLASICNELKITTVTVFSWIEEYPEFLNKYTRAKECQADFLVEEMLEIADDKSGDVIVKHSNGVPYEVEDKEFISRSRLKVETRKWLASKLKPKKYSESYKVENTGDLNLNLIQTPMTKEEIKKFNKDIEGEV